MRNSILHKISTENFNSVLRFPHAIYSIIILFTILCLTTLSVRGQVPGNVYTYVNGYYYLQDGLVEGYGSVTEEYTSMGHDDSVTITVRSPSWRTATYTSGWQSNSASGSTFLDVGLEDGLYDIFLAYSRYCRIGDITDEGQSGGQQQKQVPPFVSIQAASFAPGLIGFAEGIPSSTDLKAEIIGSASVQGSVTIQFNTYATSSNPSYSLLPSSGLNTITLDNQGAAKTAMVKVTVGQTNNNAKLRGLASITSYPANAEIKRGSLETSNELTLQ